MAVDMNYPQFYDLAPEITLRDPLAELLGACKNGLITYRYSDAVRLAGHSCPTVAGAYLMVRRALQALYREDLPERGGLRIRFAASLDDGACGVNANVVGLLTGAAGRGGFKGLGRSFRRQDTMYFGCAVEGEVQFERMDGGGVVAVNAHLHHVPAEPDCDRLLKRILIGEASPEEAGVFGFLWQDRVRRMLIDHADDPRLFSVREVVPVV